MFDFFAGVIFLSMMAFEGSFNWQQQYPHSIEEVQIVRMILTDMECHDNIDRVPTKPTTWHYHNIGRGIFYTYDAPQDWERKFLLSNELFLVGRKQFLTEYLHNLNMAVEPSRTEHIRRQLSQYIELYHNMHYAQAYSSVTYRRYFMNEYKKLVHPDYYYNGFPHDEVLRLFYTTD